MVSLNIDVGRLAIFVNFGGFRGAHVKWRSWKDVTRYVDIQALHCRFRVELYAARLFNPPHEA